MKQYFTLNDSDFSLIPNYIFRDQRLKIKDIGLLSFLLSVNLKDKPSVLKIINAFAHDGKDSIRSSIINLEKCGYLLREKDKWILKVDLIEYDYISSSSRLLLHFKTDDVARKQCWTNNELCLLRKPLEKLEEEYDWNIIYPCFKYAISRLPETGIRNRVAYVIQSMRRGCRGLYLSGLNDLDRKDIDPFYKTMKEHIESFMQKRRDVNGDE